jgi:cytochrome c biogenesis protein CcmG/thiol:disulfide interchange protein DsbE
VSASVLAWLADVRRGRFLLAAVFLLGSGWIGVSRQPVGAASGDVLTSPREGFVAPDFELPTLDRNRIRLSDLRGQVVVVNMWASWCPPCRAEMPDLQRLHDQGEGRGMVVLAVNSTVQDSESEARAFAKTYGLTMPIALDLSGDVTRAYQVRALPSTFFVDRQGIIRRVVIGGPLRSTTLETIVLEILEEGG